jgi:hypothetical protein
MTNRFKATPLKGLKWISQLDTVGLWFLFVGREITKLEDLQVVAELKNGKSFIRWGDGETANLRGKSSWHQEGDSQLSCELHRCLDYMLNVDQLVLGLPLVAMRDSITNRSSWPVWKIKVLLATRVLLNTEKFRNIPRNRISDAEIWYRRYEEIPDILKSIVMKNRPVLLISGDPSHHDVIKAICKAEFLPIHSINAFGQYQEIQSSAVEWCTKNSSERPIVLLAAGSVGKLLVMHLHPTAQVIDIGSGLSALATGIFERDWIIDPEKFK